MLNLPNRSFFDTWARIRGHRANPPPSLYDDLRDLMAPHALSRRRGSHQSWKRRLSNGNPHLLDARLVHERSFLCRRASLPIMLIAV